MGTIARGRSQGLAGRPQSRLRRTGCLRLLGDPGKDSWIGDALGRCQLGSSFCRVHPTECTLKASPRQMQEYGICRCRRLQLAAASLELVERLFGARGLLHKVGVHERRSQVFWMHLEHGADQGGRTLKFAKAGMLFRKRQRNGRPLSELPMRAAQVPNGIVRPSR